MKCELCGERQVEHTPDSPVIPWSKVGMCGPCYDRWQNGAELRATVTEYR